MTSTKTLVSMSVALSVILGFIVFLARDWMWLIIDVLCIVMLSIPYFMNLGYRYNRGTIIMSMVAPQGPVYAAGTLAGNPVSAAAGLAQIDVMCRGDTYGDVERRTSTLVSCIRESMEDAGVPGCVNSVASMYSVFFGPTGVTNASQAETTDRAMFDRLFRYMLEHGVYLAPSALELSFMSVAHDDEAVERLCEAYKGFFSEVKG